MTQHLTAATAGLAMLVLSPLAVAQSAIEVLTVDYVREGTFQGRAEIIEEGTYRIGPEDYRVDKVHHRRGGARIAEIMQWQARRFLMLDLDTKEASYRPFAGGPPPAATRVGPGPQTTQHGPQVSLGTKQVYGLTLHGSQRMMITRDAQGVEHTHVMDLWMYRGGRIPVVLEQRSQVTPDGGIDERRITGVRRDRQPRSIFDVPTGFRVR